MKHAQNCECAGCLQGKLGQAFQAAPAILSPGAHVFREACESKDLKSFVRELTDRMLRELLTATKPTAATHEVAALVWSHAGTEAISRFVDWSVE